MNEDIVKYRYVIHEIHKRCEDLKFECKLYSEKNSCYLNVYQDPMVSITLDGQHLEVDIIPRSDAQIHYIKVAISYLRIDSQKKVDKAFGLQPLTFDLRNPNSISDCMEAITKWRSNDLHFSPG